MNPHEGRCYGCGRPCEELEYCYSCKAHICGGCHRKWPAAEHRPDDHIEVQDAATAPE